jgi:hypothetical protein
LRLFLKDSGRGHLATPRLRDGASGVLRDTVREARVLRHVLTRRFQAAKEQGQTILKAEINAAIDDELPKGVATRQELVDKIVAAGLKPSDASARISASKFGVALRHVRIGRAEGPSSRRRSHRRVEAVADLAPAEHAMERKRRGFSRTRNSER